MGESRDSLSGTGIDSQSRKGTERSACSESESTDQQLSAETPDAGVSQDTRDKAQSSAPAPTSGDADYTTVIAAELVRRIRKGESTASAAAWALAEVQRIEALLDLHRAALRLDLSESLAAEGRS